jgi:hypothetical protein
VGFHVKKGKLPPRPSCLSNAEWDLVLRMTRLDPQERITMPEVAEQLQELAKNCGNRWQ